MEGEGKPQMPKPPMTPLLRKWEEMSCQHLRDGAARGKRRAQTASLRETKREADLGSIEYNRIVRHRAKGVWDHQNVLNF